MPTQERLRTTVAIREGGRWREMRAGDYERDPFRAFEDIEVVQVPWPMRPPRALPDHDLAAMTLDELDDQQEIWEGFLRAAGGSARPPYPRARCEVRLARIEAAIAALVAPGA